MELFYKAPGECQRVLSPLISPGYDLVVNVGEVPDVLDVVLQVLQQTVQDVESNVDPCMPNVGVVVDCYPADIHLDPDKRHIGVVDTR